MTESYSADGFEQLGTDVRLLEGSHSGETFLVAAADQQGVIRFYGRRPERAAIDHALLQLVRGLLPVPRVLEARTGPARDARSGVAATPRYLLCERLAGVRLDRLLADPGTTERVRQRAGGHLGELLARLSGMPFLRAGEFAGPHLAVHPFGDEGLEQRVADLRGSPGLVAWTDEELDRLTTVAARAQALSDGCSRVCLCHGDLTTSNVLVDPDTGRVTGLIDWECAYAGKPHADLGRLLRFEVDDVFCPAVLRAYADRAPNVRADFLDRAWAADLAGLIELAARAGADDSDTEASRAVELLRKIARVGDLAGGRPAWGG